ncbi:MAG: biotin/lipoyl-containing protein [Calditrichota bacterium]
MIYYLRQEENFLPIEIIESDGSYEVRYNNRNFVVDIQHVTGNKYSAIIDGKSLTLFTHKEGKEQVVTRKHNRLSHAFLTERQRIEAELFGDSAEDVGKGDVKAPMPGMILRVEVAEGDMVKVGQPLLVMEAMKMENEIKAETAGIVKSILAKELQAVEKDDLLLSIGE